MISLEEKTRIFGHYLFCNVKAGDTIITMQSIDGNTGCITSLGNAVQLPIEECKLILKPLKYITKADASKCAAFANIPAALYKFWTLHYNDQGDPVFSFPEDDVNYRNMIVFRENKLSWQQADYLRLQGYAIGVPKEIYEIENQSGQSRMV